MAKSAVWKYAFDLNGSDIASFNMPVGARVLCVREQGGNPTMWVLVDPEADHVKRTFRMIGTGHTSGDIDPAAYCGTAMLYQGSLVIHIFEIR